TSMSVIVADFYEQAGARDCCNRMSHKRAGTDEVLVEMVDKIGGPRRWHQDDHFDTSYAKRQLAIKYGAREVTRYEMAALRWCKRFGYVYRNPSHALQIMRNHTRRLGVGNETQESRS